VIVVPHRLVRISREVDDAQPIVPKNDSAAWRCVKFDNLAVIRPAACLSIYDGVDDGFATRRATNTEAPGYSAHVK
jgi:hypothetical protein